VNQDHSRSQAKPRRSGNTVAIIGAFKLLKGLLLLAVATGSLHLLHRDVAETLSPIIADLHIDPQGRHLERPLAALWALDDRALKRIGAGAFFYAALLLTEGVGLLLRQRWAEYFTVLVTGSFIPLELYELAQRATATRMLLLGVNVAVVWYLVVHLASTRRAEGGSN
jgi:uncharacterized membrane protein (DUF2068 family)